MLFRSDRATAARKGLMAGVDMDMENHLYAEYLPQLVRSGAVPESVVDEAVRRVLRVKFALGLFDHPYVNENPPVQPAPADLQLERTIAEESFVLLKNSGSTGAPILPIDAKKARTIALIGPLADDAAQMLGSWDGKGVPSDAVTLRQALTDRMKEIGGNLSYTRLYYAKGTDINGKSQEGFDEAMDAVSHADFVVLALGEDASWMTGEAASRTEIGLPGNQEQLLEAVTASGKPVVLIVFSGRPLALPWAAKHVPAILQAWFPGVQAGPALVRALFGDVSPSGKLTVSMPYSVGQEPLYYNSLTTGRPADGVDLSRMPTNGEEKYHSRYIDQYNAALFPFGYGLSYTHFSYSPVQLSSAKISAEELNAGRAKPITVSATIKNDGERAADEVVQFYIQLRGTSVARPRRELKGFKRITLEPGASQKVDFALGDDELKFWNIDMKDVVEPAEVNVWISPNSAEGKSAQLTITK